MGPYASADAALGEASVATRKTRASHASSSEKLMGPQSELATALDMVDLVKTRNVWDKHRELANIKPKFPMFGRRTRSSYMTEAGCEGGGACRGPTCIPTRGSNFPEGTTGYDRATRGARSSSHSRHDWEDGIDHSKFSPSDSEPDDPPKQWGAVRMRRGHGSLRMDRHVLWSRLTPKDEVIIRPPWVFRQAPSEEEQAEARELSDKIRWQWLFDSDNEPPVDPDGPEKENRMFVDEYQPNTTQWTHQRDSEASVAPSAALDNIIQSNGTHAIEAPQSPPCHEYTQWLRAIHGFNHLQLTNGFLHPNSHVTSLSAQQMQSLRTTSSAG
ncbi:hypothetical protein DENSPDRAFT_854016 [Dentipellis sp. KUC8613]|nr:hypothetical protein DENSPDRAFT_854016 [Dentipellis sp. KUC8613]